MNRISFLLAAACFALVVVMFAGPASADTFTVYDYSFEHKAIADGTTTTYPMARQQTNSKKAAYHPEPTWLAQEMGPTGAACVLNPTTAQIATVPDGSQVLFNAYTAPQYVNSGVTGDADVAVLFGDNASKLIDPAYDNPAFDDQGPPSVDHALELMPGYTYTVTVAIGRQATENPWGYFSGFAIGWVDKSHNGEILHQEYGVALNPGLGQWKDFTCSFNADDFLTEGAVNYHSNMVEGDTLSPLIIIGAGTMADNIRIDVSPEPDGYQPPMVPEPSTFVLLATGMLGLMAYAWRKRK